MKAIIPFITGLLTPGPSEEMRLALLILVSVSAILIVISVISSLANLVCLIRRRSGFSGPMLVIFYLATAILLTITFLAGSVYTAVT